MGGKPGPPPASKADCPPTAFIVEDNHGFKRLFLYYARLRLAISSRPALAEIHLTYCKEELIGPVADQGPFIREAVDERSLIGEDCGIEPSPIQISHVHAVVVRKGEVSDAIC